MNFDTYVPVKLITGRGCVAANSGEFAKLGNKCAIITSGSAAKKSGALGDVVAALAKEGIEFILYDKVEQNPSLLGAKEAGDMAREFGAQFIVGIGGGSPLDAAKAAAVFAANDMDAMNLYTGWKNPALPLVLIGTTAGTGSEVGPFTVMTTPGGSKKSAGGDQLCAKIAFGDPAYTDSLPYNFTVSTALDALSHAVEGYFGVMANALSDLYAAEAVRILYPNLTALSTMDDAASITPEMRDEIHYASILAGFTLGRCGTTYCHCMGYYLTEQHGVAHGFACAAFLDDFLRRGSRLLPEKAQALYGHAACTEKDLCDLIVRMRKLPALKLDTQQIDEILREENYTRSFPRAAPEGYTIEEARQLFTGLFG